MSPPLSIDLTRRSLLATTAALVIAPLPAWATKLPERPIAAIDRGEPFDDGTFFDDGFGWVD